MSPAFLVRLRPTTPWRTGSDTGERERTGAIYHSDALYSAVCSAMERLGRLDQWLAATAGAAGEPAVRFGSCFPFVGGTLYFAPPRHLWPPSAPGRQRWKGARFVPRSIVERLIAGKGIEEERWTVDPSSQCLLGVDRRGVAQAPFRIALRGSVAVDRLDTGAVAAHSLACLEFAPDAGLWFTVLFASAEARSLWGPAVTAAVRLLADSGFGGGRSRGWGRAEMPEILEGELPGLLLRVDGAGSAAQTKPAVVSEPPPESAAAIETPPIVAEPPAEEPAPPPPEAEAASELAAEPPIAMAAEPAASPAVEPVVEAIPVARPPAAEAFWLLSLYSPAPGDGIDWQRGAYSIVERDGRVESAHGWGSRKQSLRMVDEGSVLVAASDPVGAAADVAPQGHPHPVYRAGYAVSIPIPWRPV